MVSIDTAAVHEIATDLGISGNNVLDSGGTASTAAAQLAPAQTGQLYREFGERLTQACTDAAGMLTRWGSSIENCANALRQSAATFQQQEQVNTETLENTDGEVRA